MKGEAAKIRRRPDRLSDRAYFIGTHRAVIVLWALMSVAFLWLAGCDAINVGKWQPMVRTDSGEAYWLAKDVFLSAGSAANQRDAFDHNLHESVNLFFIPRNETNTYVAETIWYDPAGLEYRTIRATYDRQRESAKGDERDKSGTTRVHSMPTKELYEHKPGLWKAALKLDNELVRKLDFTVR
ncbi:MAG: hypothetical protein HY913_01455 [Desulfomonile tiedjei]|nr:hypothetical protein [Desulfomonile tiedjei]